MNDLLNTSAYINGAWVAALDGAEFAVLNPADGSIIASVPDMAAADAARAVAAASLALADWGQQGGAARAAVLLDWHAAIESHRDALARLISLEQGKPSAEAQAEVSYAAAFVAGFAAAASKDYTELLASPDSSREMRVIRQPVGVVAAITPWNFPLAMVTRKCAPALAAGCTVVLKPAEATPLSALALAQLGASAGLPPGVFNVLTCSSGERVGDELVSNPAVRKLTFTGSTATGKQLLAACAATVKNVSMELGGNAPLIVFDDADLEIAIAGAMASKFRNTGQTCICANRILVHEKIYAVFAARLAEAAAALRVGPASDSLAQQGPLINAAALSKVECHVADALARGARALCGAGQHKLGDNFYAPTVLVDVTPDMLLAQEETFGPVAPLFSFADEGEALMMANATRSGLAAYVYTSDAARSKRVAEALEYGMVGINETNISSAVAPFGGIKESGIGREGLYHGMDEFLEMKYLCSRLPNQRS